MDLDSPGIVSVCDIIDFVDAHVFTAFKLLCDISRGAM